MPLHYDQLLALELVHKNILPVVLPASERRDKETFER
jgi:hypothetical protein